MISSSSFGQLVSEEPPPDSTGPKILVASPHHQFQWWIDSQNRLANFRRCEVLPNQNIRCNAPVLLRGIPPAELRTMINFYAERLTKPLSESLKSYALAATSLTGTAALVAVSSQIPENFVKRILRGKTVAIGTVITVVAVVGYMGLGFYRNHQDRIIIQAFSDATEKDPKVPPHIFLTNDGLFKEFFRTFRLMLQDYTHGGGTFYEDGNLIFQ